MSDSGHRVIVLVGRLGVGTEDLVEVISSLGLEIIDADEIAHQLIRSGTPLFEQIVVKAGRQLLDRHGELDLSRLHALGQADSALARDLRAMTGLAVLDELRHLIRKTSGRVVFVRTRSPNAYFTLELADRIWSVSASEPSQKQALISEQGWSPDLAERFIRTQAAAVARAGPVDLTIRTDVPRPELMRAVTSGLTGLRTEALPGPEEAPTSAPVTLRETQPPEVGPEERAGMPLTTRPSIAAREDPVREETRAPTSTRPLGSVEIRLIARRLLDSLLILIAIAWLTSWGLLLAEDGRKGLPVTPITSVVQAASGVLNYLTAHPAVYFWAHQEIPWLQLVSQALGRSAGLLLLSMGIALLLGLTLGIAAARAKHRIASAITVVVSILGASTPSFLFGMILWAVNIWVHQATGLKVLPATGYGWDGHVIMPMLVLAMRPLAQVAQITYVTLREALRQDYVRTAIAKGLSWRSILRVHLLPNLLIPILNTLGSSLRFSLASLPVVEIFFRWPGIGSTLLDAIGAGTAPLVMDLTISLGLFFLLINILLEFFFPVIDPRLRSAAASEAQEQAASLADWWKQTAALLAAWAADLRAAVKPQRSSLPQLSIAPAAKLNKPENIVASRSRYVLRAALGNPVLAIGLFIVAAWVVVAILGANLETTNAYEVHGVMAIDGTYAAPPFKPTLTFPWGTDQLGRDIQALVLAGAGRTLSLAFFGMLARLFLGAILGLLAGWQRGGWFDRLVTGAIGTWAAFPATIFAMLVIQALGIQQGMWVFVVAISFVGWGEVAQFVRGQVISLSAQPFVESARSVGARVDQILVRHIFPNLVNPLVVLAALEMGGVLMLLAELGFLNIFMGGGFKVMTGESGSAAPIIAHFSDVPEWGALIANIRDQWRSHPWMALYPGLALFLAIVGFNLFGEGLRRFLDEAGVGLSRLFGRRGLVAFVAITVAVALIVGSSGPLSLYRAEGLKFNSSQVMEDIRVLSAPELQGRETGTPGADLAAIYVANRMAEIGLRPAGEHNSYFQRVVQPRLHLQAVPTFTLMDAGGGTLRQFAYRQDFSELSTLAESRGEADGRIMGVAYGPRIESETNSQFGLGNSAAVDHVIIVRAGDLSKVITRPVKAVLVIADAAEDLARRNPYPYGFARGAVAQPVVRPVLWISPEVADLLLRTTGSSLSQIDSIRASLGPGEIELTPDGSRIGVSIPAAAVEDSLDEAYLNIIGVIPGSGHFVGLEDRIVIVSAYYDGQGTDPQGVLFAGANDNASGVALMLELARLMNSSVYQPEKTILFVAWSGGERQEGLSVSDILNARPGANGMIVEAVIELSGVGAGTGNAVAIGNDSSYRLVQLFQKAAGGYGVPTTTRGRGPHYSLPAPTYLGGREAMTLSLSWDGSDRLAHLPEDTLAQIDPGKLRHVGRAACLTLLVLGRETEY